MRASASLRSSGGRRALGDLVPNTLTIIYSLATMLKETGRLEEAEALFREELDGCRGPQASGGRRSQQLQLISANMP